MRNDFRRKVIFDHLPKCGGTSLSTYLGVQYPISKTFSIDGGNPQGAVEKFKLMPQEKRFEYDLVMGHLANELFEFSHPESIKITVLRNPVDRIVSHYYYAKEDRNHYLHNKISESNISLEEYVTLNLSDELRNWYVTHFSSLSIENAEADPEEAINIAVSNLISQYDLIGFLEDLLSFTKKLEVVANYKNQFTGIRTNVTRNRPALNEVSEIAREAVAQVNFLDVAFYKRLQKGQKGDGVGPRFRTVV